MNNSNSSNNSNLGGMNSKSAPRTTEAKATAPAASSSANSNMSSGNSMSRANSEDTQSQQKAPKTIGSVIAQSLAEESQEGVDRVLGEIRQYFETSKTYINENPREAAGLAIAGAVAAWALLGTKPGRKAFEAGAAVAVPYVTKWVSRNFSGVTH